MNRLPLVALVFCAACTEDPEPPPPATEQDVLAACRAFHEAVCTTYGDCEGWSQTRIETCISSNTADCDAENAYTCWNDQADSFEGCAEDWSTRTCDEADGGFAICLWICPPPPPEY